MTFRGRVFECTVTVLFSHIGNTKKKIVIGFSPLFQIV